MPFLPRKKLPLGDLSAGALPPSRGPLQEHLALYVNPAQQNELQHLVCN